MNKPFAPLTREEIGIRALGLRRDPLAGELIALEPRMVFDGAGLAIATDAAKQAADAADAGKTDAAVKTTADAAADLAKTIAEAAVPPTAPARPPLEVVFIDSRVADIDAFKRTAGDTRLVVVVDKQDDGFAKITQTLSSLHDVSAVHIVGHGTDGAFELGNNWIGVEAVKAHDAEIKSWQNSLAHGADILLYGCDVAKTAKGDELIRVLAAESGADVAASSDVVGHTDHGADWSLEKTTGTIEARTLAPEGYAYELAVTASVPPTGFVDDVRPSVSASSGWTLVRGGTYSTAIAISNVTNDTRPAFRGDDATLGATVRLYLYADDGTKALVGTSTVTNNSQQSGKTLYSVGYGVGVSGLADLVDGKAYKFAVTLQDSGKDESVISDGDQFWILIDKIAPMQFTNNNSANLKDSSGNAIVNNTITFNSNNSAGPNYIRVYLTDQQVAESLVTVNGVTAMGNVSLKIGYLDSTNVNTTTNPLGWMRGTDSGTYRFTVGTSGSLKLDTSNQKYYIQVDPTDWFAKDALSHDDAKTVYFFFADAAGNFKDAQGNAARTAIGSYGLTSETIDAPVSVDGALSLTVRYQVAGQPSIAGLINNVGAVQKGVVSSPGLGTSNSVTDDTVPEFIIKNLGSQDATLALTLTRTDSNSQTGQTPRGDPVFMLVDDLVCS